jgi:hypothetical protein
MKSGMASSSIFSSMTSIAPLSPEFDASIEIGWFIAFALSEDGVFPREGEDVALIADFNAHRIALHLPFEAHIPDDVFPSREPRLASGQSQPAPNEDPRGDRNRRDEPLIEHAVHSAWPSQNI